MPCAHFYEKLQRLHVVEINHLKRELEFISPEVFENVRNT